MRVPQKLLKALALFEETEKSEALKRYETYYNKAIEHAFQSPEFWASRMILSGRSDKQIERVILKRLKKEKPSKS